MLNVHLSEHSEPVMEITAPRELAQLDVMHFDSQEIPEGHEVIYAVSKAAVTATVIKKDLHNLTPEEKRTFRPKVLDAMHRELQQWLDLECLKRMLRRHATNLVDGTWVLKWKKYDPRRPEGS